LFGTQLSTASAPPPVPGSVSVNSGTINLAIPDNTANGVSNIINMAGVPANATITNISVALNMPHTYPHDMIFNLKAPNGQILNLYKHHSNATVFPAASIPTAGWYNAVVNSTSAIAFGAVPDPFRYGQTAPAGPYKADAVNGGTSPGYTIMDPAGFVSNAANFAALYTTPASTTGAWTLAMADGGPGDLGTLTSWSITIDYTTPGTTTSTLSYVWSPIAGLYNDAQATIPYAGTNTPVVYAAPTTLTTYTVTATDIITGCVSTASVLVNYTPPAPTITPSAVTMCLGDPAVKLKSSSSQSFSSSFNSGTLALAIPDGPATWPQTLFPGVSTPNLAVSGIPAGATITGMSVKLNLTHTYIADMVIVLKAPNGNVFNLDAVINRTGGAGANFVNTVISSAGTTLLSAGAPPYTGTFAPDAAGATFVAAGFTFPGGPTSPAGYIPNVAAFSGLYSVPNGNYTLGIYDWGAGDLGTLTNWELTINYVLGVPATPAVWSPALGLFSDAAGTIPYVAGTAVDSVWAAPTTIGANPYTATVQSLPAFLPVPPAFTNPAPITINNVGTASPSPANLAVAGLPAAGVSVKSVNINGFSHTWAGDVNMVLQSPTGQNVILMANSNADPLIGVNNINLTFDDAAVASLPAAAPMASGTYKPTNRNGATFAFLAPGPTVTGPTFPASPTLSTFTGNMNGTWKLFVEDRVAGDAGSVAGGFTINFNVPVPPCTSPARTVIVTVNQPTTLNANLPVAQTICTDKVATFSVAVTAGTGPHSYQWQVSTAGVGGPFNNIANGGVYSGVTTATLTITAPPVSMNGYRYRCVVTGAAPCASVTSNSALLTVNPLPAFTISAAPYTSLLPGLRTTIAASAIIPPATPFVYNWIRNGTVLGTSALGVVSGLGTASILLDVDGMGDYQLRVTDANGCTNTSNTITIKDSASGKCFIYPNPTSGKFQVRYYSVANNVLPRTLTVYDAKGDRVFTQFYTIGRPYDRMDVDMRAFGKGLYWVEIGDLNGNRLTMCRVVIQ
jgi:subtilisin-like proprotein convertase family protein